MRHERAGNFLPRPFLFFLEFISQIRKNEQKLGRILFSRVTFCCGMTPYLVRDHFLPNLYREGRQQRYWLILTRFSASFGTVAREVSQNGILIRVRRIMESFQQPPRSVPDDALTIKSISRGQPALEAMTVQTCALRHPTQAKRVDKFSY
jgi:hypothetical protein